MIHVKDVVRWLTQSATENGDGDKADTPDTKPTADAVSENADDESNDLRKSFPELDFSRVVLNGRPHGGYAQNSSVCSPARAAWPQ